MIKPSNPLPGLSLPQAILFLQYFHSMTGALLSDMEQVDKILKQKEAEPLAPNDWVLAKAIEQKISQEFLVLNFALIDLLRNHRGIELI